MNISDLIALTSEARCRSADAAPAIIRDTEGQEYEILSVDVEGGQVVLSIITDRPAYSRKDKS